MIHQAAQAIASGPRTILGFCVALFTIVVAGSFSVIVAMARYEDLRYLIGWLLAFDGALTVLILIAVFLTMWLDPMRLMLGQVTGGEFIEHRRLVMGDSSSGEREVSITLPGLIHLARSSTGDEDTDQTSEGPSE